MALAMALTDTAIRKSKPGDKPYKLTDGRGLFLLVQPSGGKLWHYKYSFEGKEKLMALGSYFDVPLARARKLHQEARELLASGIDPMAERKAEKAGTDNSFQSVAELWWEQWRHDKSKRHADVLKRRMAADVYPALGSRPITLIQAPELVALVKQIEKRGAEDLAKRALQSIGQVFRYAIAHGYADRNPAAEIKPRDVLKPTRKVNLARIDPKDLLALLRDIEVYRGSHVTRIALKLMAQVFVRTTELIGAKWEEIDLEAGRWDIPAARMKMKAPHIVSLATQAIEVLEMLKTLTGSSAFLFPHERDPKRCMSNNTILKALERMGYKYEMTGHGFRGLASTILHEQGHIHEHIELQLAHAPRNAVSAAYNHALYLEPRRKMMQQWADFLEQQLRGEKVIPAGLGSQIILEAVPVRLGFEVAVEAVRHAG
jgi:integrase